MSEEKKKVGRPTKYTEDMPDRLRVYFSKPLFKKKKVQQATPSGKVVEVEIEEPCLPPFVEGFCDEQDICKDTFYEWVKKYKVFSDAFRQIKAKQATRLATHAMLGNYNASISKLILANCTDFKEEKQEIQQEIKVILPDERAKKL